MTQDLRVPWEEDPGELYEHAPCGYLTTTPDGTIVKVNETFLAWTGYTREDLIGLRRFRDLLSSGGQIYHETHYAPLLRMQNDVHEVAFDMVCADGHRLPTLVNSVLGRDPDGLPRLIRTTIFNATERRGYERELLNARRAAEDSERRVRVLQEIVAELAAAPTETGVAEALVRAPAPAFGASGGSVWLTGARPGELVAVSATDQGVSEAAAAEVARRGDLHVVGAPEEADGQLPGLAEAMREAGRATVVLLPLTTGPAADDADVRGVLAFGFAEPRRLSDSELRVVRLLGQQGGQALDRARLYDAARQREERAILLAATTREMDEEPRLTARAKRLVERLVPDVAEWASVRLQVGPAGLLAESGGPAPDADLLTAQIEEVTTAGEALWPAAGSGNAVLPLVVRGRVLGTLALRTGAEPGFLIDLADRAALALENARLYEQERAVARTLQRSLLAGTLPQDSRFVVETHYHAAAQDLEVGGDWFDAFMITPDRLAIAVGDVVGRGIDAAATMGQLRSAIRAVASADAGPAKVLKKLDRFVDRVISARMATVAYCEVNLASGTMTYACAGHLPPLLHEPATQARYLMGARSAPLGSRAGRRERVEDKVKLASGSRLLLYTDGLVERRNRTIDRGLDLMAREWARRRDAPTTGLASGFADLMVGQEHADDVCLLCLTLGTDDRMERSIGADPMQIALLRKEMRAWLASHQVDEESIQGVLLACSEAVANAIEHGYRNDPFGQVEVSATVSAEAVEVVVADRGVWRPARTDVARGRGLQLIRQVMDHVSFDRSAGTVVTMRRTRKGDS
ncbi:SpoIIE family protein phosphatase [Actinoplanes sp. NBRC 103695]|uniref:ATP-binding SpoIIE family protein phosphatase n=1 Tax=Actinoplanes sp. NBRC 103695 TaxID=3032202 RepID=UPI002555D0BA|nr:SpoIIE family protein phosphatase [Actinoplanes sp. NBRC 103695]